MINSRILQSQGSKRFVAFVVSLIVLSLMGVLALIFAHDVDAGLVVAATTSPTTLALAYVAATNWHDKNTRVATIQSAPGATQPPATTVAVKDSNVEVTGASVVEGASNK